MTRARTTALGRLRQGYLKVEAILGYRGRLCLRKKIRSKQAERPKGTCSQKWDNCVSYSCISKALTCIFSFHSRYTLMSSIIFPPILSRKTNKQKQPEFESLTSTEASGFVARLSPLAGQGKGEVWCPTSVVHSSIDSYFVNLFYKTLGGEVS